MKRMDNFTNLIITQGTQERHELVGIAMRREDG